MSFKTNKQKNLKLFLPVNYYKKKKKEQINVTCEGDVNTLKINYKFCLLLLAVIYCLLNATLKDCGKSMQSNSYL